MLIGRLHVGDRLNLGESLVSPNGEHALTLQKDGNLVLYRKGRAEWHTDTANRPQASGSSYAAVEADGNFVVAHKFWGYRWESLSNGYGARRPYVVVEDDGVISIYDDEVHGRHWCSGDFPGEIAGLFNEYTLTKRYLEKFRSDADRAEAANAKFKALRQWLEVLRMTRRVSVTRILERATWTQDHARDLGLISVVNRMQKIKDRINVEAEASRVIRKLAQYRLQYLQQHSNGNFTVSDEKGQFLKIVRGLTQERERRRAAQRRTWLKHRVGNPIGPKFGFEHDYEHCDNDDNDGSWCSECGSNESHGKDGKVSENLKHNIDFLLLTIKEVVEFEASTATAESNRALAHLFQLFIKGSYEPDFTTFGVYELNPSDIWKQTSLQYWRFANEADADTVTYGLSKDKDWFGNHISGFPQPLVGARDDCHLNDGRPTCCLGHTRHIENNGNEYEQVSTYGVNFHKSGSI